MLGGLSFVSNYYNSLPGISLGVKYPTNYLHWLLFDISTKYWQLFPIANCILHAETQPQGRGINQ
jgi:hypothetical protein